MANWFFDRESGSDDNGGDSFAVTLTGADFMSTGGTTITKATGGLTGLTGRKIFFVGLGGRTITAVASDISCTVNATVSAATYTASVGGRRLTMNGFTAANAQGFAGGDTVRTQASAPPTSLSVSGNLADCSPTIVLMGTSANVTGCDAAWTAAANVTATLNTTTFQEGTGSAQIAIGAAFTTGLAAHFDLGATVDHSTRQILSFKMQQTAGTNIVAGDITIRLCSDAVGAVSVSTFAVPLLPIGGSAAGAQNVWVPVSIDLGSAISSTVRSIALYVAVDRGAQTFLLDDFKVWTAPNLNRTIYSDGTWTSAQGASVTGSTSTTRKEGTTSSSIAVAAGATTGRVAYFATGTLVLSDYQQITFSIQQTAGTLLTATDYSITLCSDTAGVTPVNTLALPALTGSALNQWHRITIDNAGALGAAIQSIGLVCNTDTGAVTFLIDNVQACLAAGAANALSLQSLIGRPNSTGAGGTNVDTWYAIRSIVNNTITLETGPNSSAGTASRGYYGGTVNPPDIGTVFKRETIKTAFVAAPATAVQSPPVSGSAGNLVAWSGGWDRTDMSTQPSGSETWFDGGNGLGNGIGFGAIAFQSFNKFGLMRYGTSGIGTTSSGGTDINIANCHMNCEGTSATNASFRWVMSDSFLCNNNTTGYFVFNAGSTGVTLTNVAAHNNGSRGGQSYDHSAVFTNTTCCNNGTNGFEFGTGVGTNSDVTTITASRNGGTGIIVTGPEMTIRSATLAGNATYGLAPQSTSPNLVVINSTISNNTTASIDGTAQSGKTFLLNTTVSDTSEVSGQVAFKNAQVLSTRHDNTDNNHWLFTDGGTCNSQTAIRNTASGIAWQMNPTSTNRSATYPLKLSLGPYAVAAGSQTISVRLRRTNTALTMSLVCPGGRLPGIASDVTASMTDPADTWQEISITISPTSAGVIELEAWCFGGTTHTGVVDDLTIGGVSVPLDVGWRGGPFQGPPVAAGAGGTKAYATCG